MKRRSLLLIALLLFALAATATVWAAVSTVYTAPAGVLSSGGQSAASANYALTSTAGQLAVGQTGSANYALCSGFWCQVQAAQSALRRLFLPLVRR